MNSIVIVGRAVRDAEVRYSQGEKSTAFGNYTLAVDRPYKKDGDKETDFIMCKAVGKTAEFAEKYITKGVKMIVRGRMQIDNYTDKTETKDSQHIFSLSSRNLLRAKMQISRITTMYRQDNHLMEICLPIRTGSCTFRQI